MTHSNNMSNVSEVFRLKCLGVFKNSREPRARIARGGIQDS